MKLASRPSWQSIRAACCAVACIGAPLAFGGQRPTGAARSDLKVGAAAAEFVASDDMVIAGGIGGGKVTGQEGQLRAVALVLDKPSCGKFAIVACDVLFVTDSMVQAAAAQIEKRCDIPPDHLLVNATHTHSAPSTVRIHGYGPEPAFVQSVVDGIVRAVEQADKNREDGCRFSFHLGEERTVGANSRLLLADNTIYWIGPRDDAVRPTGPFDPQLPVLAFFGADDGLRGLIFNHSTHTIGSVKPNVRSPSFYGLAAQELEKDLGASVCFLEGASGSTHNITGVTTAEAVARMKQAVTAALAQAETQTVDRVAALRRPFLFRVRTFDEAAEDQKVLSYCRKRAPDHADAIAAVFRQMRQELKPEQGRERKTWIHAMRIGGVALVGVPAEYFTSLGMDIKRRSPLKNTFIAELAGDWIGYLPDREAHTLGGYQTWMGLHSYAEPGTGERMADEAVAMLRELAAEEKPAAQPTDGDQAAPVAAPGTPTEELASLKLADAELSIELVAAEPDVISPVAMCWDAEGTMYVAEMRDYPLGPAAGTIRRLVDRDGDGRYETTTVFADKLNFPNGVLCAEGGLFVTAAPDLLFLRDCDGDGVADERRIVYTGFGEGNQQLRVNGLCYGLDNWIYGANGRSDGIIRAPSEAADAGVSIRTRDFRFRPDGSRFEPVVGQSQFGQTRDDWGNRFLSWNTIAVRQALFEEADLARNPQLARFAVHNLADPSDTGEVFPLAPRPQTFNRESTHHYNALCGLTIYRGDALGDSYRGDAFVCESLCGLVHRRTLTPQGPTFVSRRGETGKEFLASADPWFHPVFAATGPDGALYVADFYRRWVEHPQFVAGAWRDEVDWREGNQHGRLWRIHRRDEHPARQPNFAAASTADLVDHLSHTNGWSRDTAQRLLVERRDASAIPLLLDGIKDAEALTAVHRLWTLAGMDALDEQVLEMALAHAAAAVRAQALVLAAGRCARSARVQAAAMRLADDADSRVRFQLARLLGATPGDATLPALVALANTPDEAGWLARAVSAAGDDCAGPLLERLMAPGTSWLCDPSDAQIEALEQLAERWLATADADTKARWLKLVCDQPESQAEPGRLAILLGGARTGHNSARSSDAAAVHPSSEQEPSAALRLRPILDQAVQMALASGVKPAYRTLAVRALGELGSPSQVGQLLPLAAPTATGPAADAALRAICRRGSAEAISSLFADWPAYAPGRRRLLVAAALESMPANRAFLEALEAGVVRAVEIDPSARAAFGKTGDIELAARAERIFAAAAPQPRDDVLSKYQGALDLLPNRERGATIFKAHCMTCHVMFGLGRQAGPDLSGIASRPKENLLSDLLDPSRTVAPDYLSYTLLTRDGRALSGILISDTADAVTLRRGEGGDDTLPRGAIDELQASDKSLMPEGFEQRLSVQDVADVLEFLARPERRLLE